VGVDTPEDVAVVERLLRAGKSRRKSATRKIG
jgi:hypothetical protein